MKLLYSFSDTEVILKYKKYFYLTYFIYATLIKHTVFPILQENQKYRMKKV